MTNQCDACREKDKDEYIKLLNEEIELLRTELFNQWSMPHMAKHDDPGKRYVKNIFLSLPVSLRKGKSSFEIMDAEYKTWKAHNDPR